MNKLEQLRAITTVVADTGDIAAIRQYNPVDATTNPSLLFKVAATAEYQSYVDRAISWSRQRGGSNEEQMADCVDSLAVSVGADIAGIVPGRISTEVSARLSFNTSATVDRARKLIQFYEDRGVSRERVLIKIASTWEGIQAAEILEKQGIQCNLTLLFSFAQAKACADAGVFLVSPFVGRIYDWYKKQTGEEYHGADDPGVQSVTRIYNYYKTRGLPTIVMGASFRNIGQIEALAGCDRLTISPQLLSELASDTSALARQLSPSAAQSSDPREIMAENEFRWQHNEDAMATEKLSEGIRLFHADELKLEALIRSLA